MIRRPYIFVIIAVIIVAGVTSFFVFSSLGGGSSTASCTNIGKTVNFTIIESDYGPMEGMNGSYNQYQKGIYTWPVIKVQCNDTVVIHVENVNSSEPHGFEILYYSSSVELQAGQSHTVTFKATEVGTFKMYCSIFCSIHAYMQGGEVIVTS